MSSVRGPGRCLFRSPYGYLTIFGCPPPTPDVDDVVPAPTPPAPTPTPCPPCPPSRTKVNWLFTIDTYGCAQGEYDGYDGYSYSGYDGYGGYGGNYHLTVPLSQVNKVLAHSVDPLGHAEDIDVAAFVKSWGETNGVKHPFRVDCPKANITYRDQVTHKAYSSHATIKNARLNTDYATGNQSLLLTLNVLHGMLPDTTKHHLRHSMCGAQIVIDPNTATTPTIADHISQYPGCGWCGPLDKNLAAGNSSLY